MEMQFNGKWYVCIEDSTAKYNQYKLYHRWYDMGWHRKKIAEYANFDSVLFYLLQSKYPVASWDLTA
jgi:hypothetical protein